MFFIIFAVFNLLTLKFTAYEKDYICYVVCSYGCIQRVGTAPIGIIRCR